MSPQVCAVDNEGRKVFVNPSWTAFGDENGYRGDGFLGVSYVDICAQVTGAERETAASFLAGLAEVIRGAKESFTYFYGCHYPAGKRWYRSIVQRCAPNLTGIMHVDVTEDVESAKQELQRLSHARLVHDMKTPLQSIIGSTELVLHGIQDTKAADHLERALRGCQHLSELIDNVLTVAADEFNADPRNDEQISVPELLHEVADEAKTLAEKAGVTLHDPIVAPGLPTLLGVRSQVRRALANLVSNAIKYNRPNGDIRVSATLNMSQGIELAIEDSGLGMDEEQVARFGKPFERLGARGTEAGGSGLGAAVMMAHDGTFSVDSRRNAGTAIRLVFPRWRTNA